MVWPQSTYGSGRKDTMEQIVGYERTSFQRNRRYLPYVLDRPDREINLSETYSRRVASWSRPPPTRYLTLAPTKSMTQKRL